MALIQGGRSYFQRLSLALIFALIISSGLLIADPVPQKTAARELSDQDLDRMLSIAEAQFEVVKLLVKQGRYDRVLPEMNKIYGLGLPEKYEQAVAESASLAADLLVEKSQFELAHQVLDEALKHMRRNASKAALLKVEAIVFKSEGNLDKALQSLEQAINLEQQGARP
jgi:tetratricopeptide (TPR) repeat protein